MPKKSQKKQQTRGSQKRPEQEVQLTDGEWENLSPHEKLGVDKKATIAQIRQAYRKKALELHPDKRKQDEPIEDRLRAQKRFIGIHAAWEELHQVKRNCGVDGACPDTSSKADERAEARAQTAKDDLEETLAFANERRELFMSAMRSHKKWMAQLNYVEVDQLKFWNGELSDDHEDIDKAFIHQAGQLCNELRYLEDQLKQAGERLWKEQWKEQQKKTRAAEMEAAKQAFLEKKAAKEAAEAAAAEASRRETERPAESLDDKAKKDAAPLADGCPSWVPTKFVFVESLLEDISFTGLFSPSFFSWGGSPVSLPVEVPEKSLAKAVRDDEEPAPEPLATSTPRAIEN